MDSIESILISIKKLIGIIEEDTNFDIDIIIHINSVFMVLNQLGVGPEEGFSITGSEEVWEDYVSNEDNLEAIKTFMALKVKLIFDPPASSVVVEAMKQTISEMEWRLNVMAETSTT